MTRCRHCHAKIAEDRTQCDDVKACARRVAKRLQPRFARMATRPFVGFDPDKAYQEAPKLLSPTEGPAP